MSNEDMEALDSGRHSTGAYSIDFLNFTQGYAITEIALVSTPVRIGEFRITAQPFLHVTHHTIRFEGADGSR
jgi:hypothetical protein